MKIKILLFALPLFLVACSGGAGESQNDAEKETEEKGIVDETDSDMEVAETAVFFTNLTEGSDVKNPVTIEMGVKGMKLEPAGAINENAGHHHLVIDGTFVPSGKIVPSSETSIHYGAAQTEGTVTLSPGPHTLTLQFADGVHASYGESMSSTISVNVVE